MLSDLTNFFDETPETCVLNSLSTRIIQKNQIIMTGAVILTLLLSCNFSQADSLSSVTRNSGFEYSPFSANSLSIAALAASSAACRKASGSITPSASS